jgi:hypothetical protein
MLLADNGHGFRTLALAQEAVERKVAEQKADDERRRAEEWVSHQPPLLEELNPEDGEDEGQDD